MGEANVLYDCDAHAGKQTPVTEWSGGAGDFVAAALLSFDHLFAAPETAAAGCNSRATAAVQPADTPINRPHFARTSDPDRAELPIGPP